MEKSEADTARPAVAGELRVDPEAVKEKFKQLREAVYSEFQGQEKIDKPASLAAGKALRKEVPRKSQAEWTVEKGRSRGVDLLKQQESDRVQELLSIRHERMAVSPFTFYRGAAIIMADDLSKTPSTGIRVQDCGDAHIANFGIFGSAEGRLVFDLNDFDETLPAPWEWDVKRFLTSVEICGRDRGFSEKERRKIVRNTAKYYRESMQTFSELGNLEVWYAHIDIENLLESDSIELKSESSRQIRKTISKAMNKNSAAAAAKLTETVDGKQQIISDPPLIVPMRELAGDEGEKALQYLGLVLKKYRMSLPRERRSLIDQYSIVDMARKVVGVGSVGTRAWIVVLEGADPTDTLVLQVKEASESVLEPYAQKSEFANHGRRVVEGLRATQTAGDIFTGWVTIADMDGTSKDYYVRQLWNAKGSIDLTDITRDNLKGLAKMCAWTLAHEHAKTGNRHEIAGYLGKGEAFDEAMAEFASKYADQNEADYQMFLKAQE